MLRRTLVLTLVVLAAALASAVAAQAEIVVKQDNAGRSITFDVQAATADVEWYANLLRNAAHGNEISNVTIRIVPSSSISSLCGAAALACYSSRRSGTGVITVPADGPTDVVAHSVVHEYGHHLDSAWSVPGVQELNGTPVWWAARGMASLVSTNSVAFDYSRGWDHSVGEIFAEDYAYIHLGGSYKIPWLTPPDDVLKTALLAELGGATITPPATPTTPPTTTTRPVTVTRSGTLAAGATRSLPFTLLGPGRRVTVDAAVSRLLRRGAAGARLDVVCNGTVVATTGVAAGRTATLDSRNLGPASCTAALVSTATTGQRYSVRLRLAVES